jgi:uncharacterized membrane protein
MRLAMNFAVGTYPVLLLVLTALGVSMIVLALLVHLPLRLVGGFGIAIVLLHNLLDPVSPPALGSLAPLWILLHQPGVIPVGGVAIVVGYPVLAWIGVMLTGFWAGQVFERTPADRQRVLRRTGLLLVAGFVLLRAANVYGDPAQWAGQPTPLLTALSFLRVTKYPPSLAFLLMTLGPALVALAWLDRRALPPERPLVVIGRVPFFFYVSHFFVLHAVAWLAAWARYGADAYAFLFAPFPSMGGPPALFPAGFGYPLWVVYVAWLAVVAALYPACRGFATLKATRRVWWTSYL